MVIMNPDGSMRPTTLSHFQIEQFIADGFVIVKGGIPRAIAADWGQKAFERLGYDPADSATWKKPRIHMPPSRVVDPRFFAPHVWGAMSDLVGGADRIIDEQLWGDCFVVNIAEGADRPWEAPSPTTGECWHKDGHVHFLDSQDLGLLVLIAWTDIRHMGGGTFLAPDSIGVVARHLAQHPQGSPGTFGKDVVHECRRFTELIADAGDVILVHPYMLHSVSQNCIGVPRILSNHPTWLREPLRFNREDPRHYSPVERAVLQGLGVETFDFVPDPTTPEQRLPVIPRWMGYGQQVYRERVAAGKNFPPEGCIIPPHFIDE